MKKVGIGLVVLAALAASACSMTGGVRDRSQLVAQPDLCRAQRFDVYFADGQAGLTPSATAAIDMAATALKDCRIDKVQVIGLADARGGAAANLSLSERRAQNVAAALTRAGWPAPAFDVTAAGDAGAVTDTGAREPLRRRTEVLIEASRP
ncbi:MAG: OmpA family protein [Variovorax sp.]|nr:MAG: OmpA family protein [Variovorax sp.]